MLRHALRASRCGSQPACGFELVGRTATGKAQGAARGGCPQPATAGECCYYHRKVDERLIA